MSNFRLEFNFRSTCGIHLFKIKEVDRNNCKAKEKLQSQHHFDVPHNKVVPIFEHGPPFYGGTTLNELKKLNSYKKNLRNLFRIKPSDSIFDTLFEFEISLIFELYKKHLLSFSLKSYFGLHSNKMMNEILTANQNFSYNTRSKTTRIVQTITSKRNSTRTSLGYRGKILINILLKQKILPQLETKPCPV